MRGENSTADPGFVLVLTASRPADAESNFTRSVSFSDGVSGSVGMSARRPAVIVNRSLTAHWSWRSEEHTSELQSPYVISYAVFCLQKKKNQHTEGARVSSAHHTRHRGPH